MTKQVCFTLHHWKKFQCKIKQFESEFLWFLLILVNRAYCIIYYSCIYKEEGWAQLFVFLFVFFLYNLQILWGFKINFECWYVVGIAVFFVVSRSHLFSFLFVFAGYQNTIQSNNVFFYVIVNSRSLQINSIYVCVFSVQEV